MEKTQSDKARTILAQTLLDMGASKLEVMELVVKHVMRVFPELSADEHKALAWQFLTDLTAEAQRLEAC